MKNLTTLSASFLLMAFLWVRCGKDNPSQPADPPAGGAGYNARDTTISLQAGRVTLDIPRGAFKQGTSVKITQSTAKFIDSAAVIDQFQLLPEGTVFKKPVMLVVHYDAGWLKGNSPFNIGVAFRNDQDGKWYAPIHGTVDTVAHRIAVPITHFSHWSLYTCFHLEAQYEDQLSTDNARVMTMPTSASALLRCYMDGPPVTMTTKDAEDGDLPLIAPLVVDPVTKGTGVDLDDCPDCDLIAPLVPPESRNEDSRAISPAFWYVNGVTNGNAQTGTLSRLDKAYTYHSPGKVPEGNPVAIAAGIRTRGGGEIQLIQSVAISGGLTWKITLTTTYETQDPYSIHTTTALKAVFFIRADGKSYNTGDASAQLLYLDSAWIDPPVTHVTINNYDQFTSYKISYKSPAYACQPGLIGAYDTKKKTLHLALGLTEIGGTQIRNYCYTPHNGSGGDCVTDTENPLPLSTLERDDLPAQEGYTETYVNTFDEEMGVTTVSKLSIQSTP